MNRKEFIIGATAAGLASALPAAEKDGLRLRFLGTGAADWNGKDNRGEQRRWSSILVDDAVLVDFTMQDADKRIRGKYEECYFHC